MNANGRLWPLLPLIVGMVLGGSIVQVAGGRGQAQVRVIEGYAFAVNDPGVLGGLFWARPAIPQMGDPTRPAPR